MRASLRHRAWPWCPLCAGVALDLGSARTRVLIEGRGTVVDVPTVTFPGGGPVHPVQRGTIVDAPGCGRMLRRLVGRRLPPFTRPLVIVTAPALGGVDYRERARAAVDVLGPRTVMTVPGARAVALAAGDDLTRPLLVLDLGAHLTEVVLLCDGAVTDARRAALGTEDLDGAADGDAAVELLVATVADMVDRMRRQDRGVRTAAALRRGLLVAGGGALRPELTRALVDRLHVPLRVVEAPQTAAVRGAAQLLRSAHTHPSAAEDHRVASPTR
jgi:rod shape-determining protein MreB